MATVKAAKKKGRNPNRTKEWAYRWLWTNEETWAKVERITKRMQAMPENRPNRIKANMVASEIFRKAVEAIPE